MPRTHPRQVCQRKHVTFTMVRCPFDRLASSYLDKVVLRLGSGCNEPRRRLREAGVERPTFRQFVDVLVGVPLSRQDPHTLPFSHRCATNHFEYDLVGNLSTFDDDMATLFEALELRQAYTPVHAKNLGLKFRRAPREWLRINQTLQDFGIRPDVLFMHGRERVDYFYDDATKAKVRNSFWREDVDMFAES